MAAMTACAAAPPPQARLLAATIAPLADLLARVAGSSWEVKTVVPPGTSAHVFEPLPRDVKQVARVRLLFVVGAGYDAWVERMVTAAAAKAVVHDGAASVGVVGTGDHEDEGRVGRDPHWWLSPALAARATGPLAERLAAIDPAGAAGYRERAKRLTEELARLDEELAGTLAALRGRSFVSSHAAWVYLAERYGLREAAAIEEVPGREPTPRALVALIREARDERMTTLFVEPQFPPGAARVVAAEAGLGIALLDPIGGVPGRIGYDEMMRFNAAQLARGLGARP